MTTDDFATNCIRWEAQCPWMYLDTKGLVTVGVGNLLPTAESAVALPFNDAFAAGLALERSVRQAWLEVHGMRPGMIASFYKGQRPFLTSANIRMVLTHRLEGEFLPGLRHIFLDFDKLPDAAQGALLDMAFNLGLGGFYNGFPKLTAAVRTEDFLTAANECHRSTCRDDRNKWTQDLFSTALLERTGT